MKLIREMKAVKDRVEALLLQYPHLRDSDSKLTATIWRQDLLNKGFKSRLITGFDFLSLYSDEELTNAETIRRVRQKLQEENPALRGQAYNSRQGEGEEVRKEINQ